jgi:sulfite reductase beta subunit-like hemoprotein
MARPTNFNNIDKPLSSGGPEMAPLDMQQFIKLADAEKFEADSLSEIIETLREKFDEEKKPGESFDSWLKRTPR